MSSLLGADCVKWEGLQDKKKTVSVIRTFIIEMGKMKRAERE